MFHVSRLRPEFLVRASLVALLVIIAHQCQWNRLRFATSEAVLRVLAIMNTRTERVSSDVILVEGRLFHFVTACTFIDVCMGSIPLLWNVKKSVFWNTLWLTLVQSLLLAFNLVRLTAAQILCVHGLPWMLADQFLGGIAYFAVWQFIWWQRSWNPAS